MTVKSLFPATSFIVSPIYYIRTSEIQILDMVAYFHNKPLNHGNANALGESHHPGHWLRLRLRLRKNTIKKLVTFLRYTMVLRCILMKISKKNW